MDDVELYFNNSLEALKDSELAFNNERYKLSINRSYYPVFYVAKALLTKKGITTKKHGGTIHQFGLEYVVNDEFDREIAQIFSDLEELRNDADYDIHLIFNKKTAEDALKNAKIFIKESEKFIQ